MAVPYTFGTATSAIPLSQLDTNFSTPITLGNTAIQLGNTVTTLNNMTLANVTISSGNVTITSTTVTNANVTGTLTLSGLTASTALALDASKNVVSVTNTGTGNNVLSASPTLTGTTSIATLNLTNALGTAYGGTGLTSFTANGVVYASSTSALTTGSALTFDGNAQTITHTSGYGLAITRSTKSLTFNGNYAAGNTNADINSDLPISFSLSGSEQMRLNSTGLGIGTSSPAQKLTVAGNAQIQGSNTYLYIDNGGVGGSALKAEVTGSTSVAIGSDSNHPLLFKTNATERARIDSSGNLLVGTTSADIIGAQTDGATFRYQTSGLLSVNKSEGVAINVGRSTSTGTLVNFYYNAAVKGTISTDGTNTAYNTSSDYRLKENVQPMTGALAKVQALKPCTYNWKQSGLEGEGFIAHELAEVVPGCVTGEKDAVDAEGNPVYQGVDTSFLVATLTAAIQELKAEVDSLKAQLNKGA